MVGEHPLLSHRLRTSVLLGYCVLLLVPTWRILGGAPIYGDDHSSHLVVISHLIELLKAGQTDFHCPTFNLGFPMYVYYQPLPHLLVAFLHFISFGLLSVQAAFNLSVLLAWAIYPLTTFVGARRLGLDGDTALLCALCAPLISSEFTFGFTVHAVMGLGLFTQTFAMVLFPLALGTLWRSLDAQATRRQVIGAAGLLTLVCLSHAFYGVVLATASVLMLLARPRQLRASTPRIAVVGGLTAVSLLFWLIPLMQVHDFAGGWPWGGPDRWQGYGAWRVAKAFFLGRLFDQHQLPTISLALVGGLVVAVKSFRQKPVLRVLALCFALFVAFLIGRRSLGHLVDVMPLNLGIQMFRYIGAVHAFAVILAGVGLVVVARFFAARLPRWAVFTVVGSLLLSPMLNYVLRAGAFFHTISSYAITEPDLRAFGRAIDKSVAAGQAPGRIYSHNKAGYGTHLVAALLAKYTRQPMGQSYGVGMHDSLGFFYLEYFQPKNAALASLYNFRFALTKVGKPLDKHLQAKKSEPLVQRKDLRLYLLGETSRYFRLVDLDFQIAGKPRATRKTVRQWLASPLVARGQFGAIVSAGDPADERPPYGKVTARTRPAAGTISGQTIAHNRYAASVELKRKSTLMLKVNYHPFWRLSVNGVSHATEQVTPSYLAVTLPKGKHDVVFRFRNPSGQKLLWLLTPLLWIGLLVAPWLIERKRARRAPQ